MTGVTSWQVHVPRSSDVLALRAAAARANVKVAVTDEPTLIERIHAALAKDPRYVNGK